MRAGSTFKNLKQLCFICNEQRECDTNSYNNGGLGRCESKGSKAKLQEKMTQFLQDKEHKFHEAATRLQMKISFEAHDFYVVDVFYHNSCYIKFAIKKKLTVNKDERWKMTMENNVLEEFLLSLRSV